MKKRIFKVGLLALMTMTSGVVVDALPGFEQIAIASTKVQQATKMEATKLKGKITNISQKAKTIALSKKDKSFFLLKFNDETELKGVKSAKEFKVGEAILVHYKTVNGENIASSMAKALVKLPKGVKEVKTKELASLLEQDKNLVIIDARPPVKFGESHIEGAQSIPFSKVIKMGKDGNKLFEKYKDKQLVFYCGGPT